MPQAKSQRDEIFKRMLKDLTGINLIRKAELDKRSITIFYQQRKRADVNIHDIAIIFIFCMSLFGSMGTKIKKISLIICDSEEDPLAKIIWKGNLKDFHKKTELEMVNALGDITIKKIDPRLKLSEENILKQLSGPRFKRFNERLRNLEKNLDRVVIKKET